MKLSFRAFFFFLSLAIGASSVVYSAQFTKEQLYQLATLAARDEHYEQSLELYQKAVELDPKFAPAYNGIGLLYQSRPDPDIAEAVRYFKLAVEIEPLFVEAWNNLGKAYYSSERFIQANKALSRSLEINPDQPDIELVLAWVLLLGESKASDAIEHFKKALSKLDNDAAHYGLGLAYLLTDDRNFVLDEITYLRQHQKDDQARKLEKMLSAKLRIISDEGKPLVTGDGSEKSLFDEQLKTMGDRVASKDGEIKVRLRGPLEY